MEFIYCNACCSRSCPSLGGSIRLYYLTSCGHVFCDGCSENNIKKEFCSLCNLKCHIAEISPESPKEIKAYFLDPMAVFQDGVKRAMLINRFQQNQKRILETFFLKLVDSRKSLQLANNALRAENEKLKQIIIDNAEPATRMPKIVPSKVVPIGTGRYQTLRTPAQGGSNIVGAFSASSRSQNTGLNNSSTPTLVERLKMLRCKVTTPGSKKSDSSEQFLDLTKVRR